MKPFDIYEADHPWRTSEYRRPFLLVRPTPAGGWLCFALSTKDYGGAPFEVNNDDPDFPATGLSDTSYIYDSRFEEVATDEFRKRYGELAGNLLARFRANSGV
jgi:hypothetical protein